MLYYGRIRWGGSSTILNLDYRIRKLTLPVAVVIFMAIWRWFPLRCYFALTPLRQSTCRANASRLGDNHDMQAQRSMTTTYLMEVWGIVLGNVCQPTWNTEEGNS